MPKIQLRSILCAIALCGCSEPAPSPNGSAGMSAPAPAAGTASMANGIGAAGNSAAATAPAAGSAATSTTRSGASGSGSPAANSGGMASATRAGAGGSGATAANGGAGAGGSTTQAGTAGAAGRAPITTSDCSADPLEVLRSFAPADEDVAEDFEAYLTDELGTLACATSGSGAARTITQTIFVPPNAVYDGKGETLTADAAMMNCDTSEGEQAEQQRPYFVLAPGAQLKNVTFDYPGCEGVHMMGDNVLDHITWRDAGEDAASVRSYFPGGKITISNSEGHKAEDKMFQFNAPCDVRIENFTGSDMGKLVRQNGGEDFPLKIDLNTVAISGVVSAVVQSDSPMCFVRYHDLSYQFTGSGDKADRVFRGIPAGNVSQY
jgi:hypothetical protein